ncbi:MAG: NAD(P)-dependent oxidoreductase [bacterium]
MSQKLGYIGLGKMGLALSKSLLKNGYDVYGYDIDPKRLEMLKEIGGNPVSSAKELAETCDVVFSILLKTDHIEENTFGEKGITKAEKKDFVFVEMSTMYPSWQVDLSERLRNEGIEMLDAPISGSHPKVDDKTISIMVGGKKDVFDQVAPVLESIASNVHYTGQNGSGATMKIVTNLFVNSNAALLAEMVLVGEKAGLSHETMMECLRTGSVKGAMLEQMAPRLFTRDFAPRGAVEIFVKDMGMAIELAEENGIDLKVVKASREMFQKAEKAGWGKDDASRVIEVYEGKAD